MDKVIALLIKEYIKSVLTNLSYSIQEHIAYDERIHGNKLLMEYNPNDDIIICQELLLDFIDITIYEKEEVK